MHKRTPRSPFLEKLGKRIAQCEDRCQFRTQTFAGMIGVTNGTMSRYRLGRCEPSLETLRRIADACAVRFEWLALGEGERDRLRNDHVVLDHQAYARIDILDEMGDGTSDDLCGYIPRLWFSNLAEISPDRPIRGFRLAAFRIKDAVPGQRFPNGAWVLVDLNCTAPSDGWCCLKAPSKKAYVRELDIDEEGRIDVLWPRCSRPTVITRYEPATFGTRFSIIGKVLGQFLAP